MSKQVVVLGATGMLGAMVLDVFARDPGFHVVATARTDKLGAHANLPRAWKRLDAATATLDDCRQALAGAAWAVNCIGITKPLIADDDAFKVERALRVNSLFPHTLATAAQATGTRVIQIATDCVYSGTAGNYREDTPHDALDVYGKTKSLGEVTSPNIHHLRASIIGPEPKEHKFLLDWFLGQPRAATLNGFTNHDWNGVTTLAFARVALGIARNDLALPRLQHLVPAGRMTKAEMLATFARAFGRDDVKINNVKAGSVIDRTLLTNDEATNSRLWVNGGYAKAPTVEEMIVEMAQFKPHFERALVA